MTRRLIDAGCKVHSAWPASATSLPSHSSQGTTLTPILLHVSILERNEPFLRRPGVAMATAVVFSRRMNVLGRRHKPLFVERRSAGPGGPN